MNENGILYAWHPAYLPHLPPSGSVLVLSGSQQLMATKAETSTMEKNFFQLEGPPTLWKFLLCFMVLRNPQN